MSDQQRPRNRSECKDGPRPCPWVSCRYHLALDVAPNNQVFFDPILLDDPAAYLKNMAHTCALDVADQGPHHLHEIGALMRSGTTGEAARQAEESALARIRALHPDDADGEEYDMQAIAAARQAALTAPARAQAEREARRRAAEAKNEAKRRERAEAALQRSRDAAQQRARNSMDQSARAKMSRAKCRALLSLRETMDERGLIEADIARMIGVPPKALRSLWYGGASAYYVPIAEALGVALEELCSDVQWLYATRLRARLLAKKKEQRMRKKYMTSRRVFAPRAQIHAILRGWLDSQPDHREALEIIQDLSRWAGYLSAVVVCVAATERGLIGAESMGQEIQQMAQAASKRGLSGVGVMIRGAQS